MLHLKPEAAVAPHPPKPRSVKAVGSVASGPYRVLVYDQPAFEDLAWPQASDDATLETYVYQSREFLSAWLPTMGQARQARPYFVVVEDRDGRPAMWLPLVIERQLGCTFLRFPDGGMADYNGPSLRKNLDLGPDMSALWAAILRLLPAVDVVDFVKMPETIWDRPNPFLRIGTTAQKDEGYYLPIVGTFDAYLADSTRKPRVKKLRQLFRKLERQGPVQLGEVRDPETVGRARAFVEHHKTLQYRRTLGFSQFDKPGVRAFVDKLCEQESLASFTRMTALIHNDAVVGAQLDFVTPRRQQGFMTTFDAEQFGFFSPGRQVQLHLIERAFADQLRVFDLGHGDNPYKHPWMTDVLRLHSFELARSWRGHLFLKARALRRKLPTGMVRRLRDRVRPGEAKAPKATEAEA